MTYQVSEATARRIIGQTAPILRRETAPAVFLSGTKKRHTQKAQLIVADGSKAIVCVATGKGVEHDSHLLKRSRVLPGTRRLADSGYVGMDRDLVSGKRVRGPARTCCRTSATAVRG